MKVYYLIDLYNFLRYVRQSSNSYPKKDKETTSSSHREKGMLKEKKEKMMILNYFERGVRSKARI